MKDPFPSRAADTAPGWYGKLACLGDFAHRRLSARWVETCDTWLSATLRASQAELGARWLDVYLTAPLLRFAWAPGVIDSQWWFGVLMPSCDNVGRYYPLIIVQPRERPPEDRIALDHLERWYEQVGHAAIATLDDEGASVDALEQALDDAAPWPTASASRGVTLVEDAIGLRLGAHSPSDLASLLGGWATQDVVTNLAGCSAWWPAGRPAGTQSIEIVRGLPDATQFVGLLNDHGTAAVAGGTSANGSQPVVTRER